MRRDEIDPVLQPWDAISGEHEWNSLLVGNGASQAVWSKYAYKSLYDVATRQPTNPLTGADQNLFTAFNTTNFELVLSSLATAKVVNDELGVVSPIIGQRYKSIQDALVQSVRDAHLPWNKYPDPTKDAIKQALSAHPFVFSTNYDLLLYWAINHNGAAGFKDYFWRAKFDLANSDEWGKATYVLYLHGGIHLYRTKHGRTVKHQAQGSNLLADFGTLADHVPLFVAEGSAASKLDAIRRSDYLSFAYSKLLKLDGPMVIFGSRLDATDNHIATAINKAKVPVVAVSIYPSNPTAQKQAKAHFHQVLPNKDLYFFDSKTHPLGSPTLLVP